MLSNILLDALVEFSAETAHVLGMAVDDLSEIVILFSVLLAELADISAS